MQEGQWTVTGRKGEGKMGQPVENTLHDLRWGDWDASGTVEDYVWVFLISGSAPPAHFRGGWKGASSERQPAMYFPNGGSTLKGYAKPGEIIWSRIFVQDGKLHMDIGRGQAISLPPESLSLHPAGKGSRSLMWNGQWRDMSLFAGTSNYLFAAKVPLKYRAMEMQQVLKSCAPVQRDSVLKQVPQVVAHLNVESDDEFDWCEVTESSGSDAQVTVAMIDLSSGSSDQAEAAEEPAGIPWARVSEPGRLRRASLARHERGSRPRARR